MSFLTKTQSFGESRTEDKSDTSTSTIRRLFNKVILIAIYTTAAQNYGDA